MSVLISARSFRKTNYTAMIDDVRPRPGSLRDVVLIDDGADGKGTSWSAFLDQGDVKEFCRGRSLPTRRALYVRFTDEFPMTVTVTGRIQKFKMREQSVAELDLQDLA